MATFDVSCPSLIVSLFVMLFFRYVVQHSCQYETTAPDIMIPNIFHYTKHSHEQFEVPSFEIISVILKND